MAEQLVNFQYKGISLGKYVEGEIEALNNAEAAHKLKEQKVIITKLTQVKKKVVKEKKKGTSFFTPLYMIECSVMRIKQRVHNKE